MPLAISPSIAATPSYDNDGPSSNINDILARYTTTAADRDYGARYGIQWVTVVNSYGIDSGYGKNLTIRLFEKDTVVGTTVQGTVDNRVR